MPNWKRCDLIIIERLSKGTEIEFLIKVHIEMHLSHGVISGLNVVHSNAAIVFDKVMGGGVGSSKYSLSLRVRRDCNEIDQ